MRRSAATSIRRAIASNCNSCAGRWKTASRCWDFAVDCRSSTSHAADRSGRTWPRSSPALQKHDYFPKAGYSTRAPRAQRCTRIAYAIARAVSMAPSRSTVNSMHHQGIKHLGEGLVVSAMRAGWPDRSDGRPGRGVHHGRAVASGSVRDGRPAHPSSFRRHSFAAAEWAVRHGRRACRERRRTTRGDRLFGGVDAGAVSLTVGIEEEYQIIDPVTRDLTPGFEALVTSDDAILAGSEGGAASVPGGNRHEGHASTIAELRADLTNLAGW